MSDSFIRERDHLQGLHWKCFGCGESNPIGLKLNVRLVGEKTEVQFTPLREHQGPPGVAHSGVVAAVLDEVMSQLVFAQLNLAVTRKMEITYPAPRPHRADVHLHGLGSEPELPDHRHPW